MYKSTGFRHIGSMSSAAANTTLALRLPQTALVSSVPHARVGREREGLGSFRAVEIMLASSAENESFTCVVWQAKRILSKTSEPFAWVSSPLCTISCSSGADAPGSLTTGTGEMLYCCHTYTVTATGNATSPKGVGTATDSAYNGGLQAFSPGNGGDGRVIITDFGGAEILLLDIYGASALSRHAFVEAVV